MEGIGIDSGNASSEGTVETVCQFRRSWALLPRAGATFPDSASPASSFLSNAGDLLENIRGSRRRSHFRLDGDV